MSRIVRPPAGVVVAAAAIVLHLLDDNLVEPGWGDATGHLASTLVPVAIVVALAFASVAERLRPGGRAIASLAVGFLGVTFSFEAVQHYATEGLARDDWTGLASLAGGLFLLGRGARDLWRSRRQDEPRRRRYARRALKTGAALVVAVNVAFPIADAYIGVNMARRTVPAAHLGVGHEDVSFRSTDGLRLAGWYVPSTNRAAVIVYPGRGGTQQHARMLIDHGYGVLLLDHRGVGDSEGDHNSWGWGSEHDIHGAVAFLQERPDVDPDRIGGLGLSVGEEVLLHAAAENEGLHAVVSEGAGARSWSEFRHGDGPGPWIWAPVTINRQIATSVLANRMPPPGLHGLVPRIEAPLFFIHATDGVGGEELTLDYHRLARGPKQLWQTAGGHTRGIDTEPGAYERKVTDFLDDALLG